MIVPSTNSFTPLSTLHLPVPHVLHPDACNPVMDLVVLHALMEDGNSDTRVTKRINDVTERGETVEGGPAPPRTKVALWRMSGSKVWEVDLVGKVAGLAWSQDGRAVLTLVRTQLRSSRSTFVAAHVSVFFGTRDVPLNEQKLPSGCCNPRASLRA